MIETISGTFACPDCRKVWVRDAAVPVRPVGEGVVYAVAKNDGYVCDCGGPIVFRVLRRSEPIPKHPREHT